MSNSGSDLSHHELSGPSEYLRKSSSSSIISSSNRKVFKKRSSSSVLSTSSFDDSSTIKKSVSSMSSIGDEDVGDWFENDEVQTILNMQSTDAVGQELCQVVMPQSLKSSLAGDNRMIYEALENMADLRFSGLSSYTQQTLISSVKLSKYVVIIFVYICKHFDRV